MLTPRPRKITRVTAPRGWCRCSAESWLWDGRRTARSPVRSGCVELGSRDSSSNRCGARSDSRHLSRGARKPPSRVEQASEQPVRAPGFEPLLGPATSEPDVEVAELVEHSGAVEQRAAVDWIQLASSDVEHGSAGVRVEARTVLGNEGVGREPAQVDLGGAEQGELEVEQGDDVARPTGRSSARGRRG